MQNLRIAAVSMNSELGKRKETLRRMEQFCEQAVAEGAELVVFPELIVHGHCTPNTWEIAEPIPTGESVETLCNIAKRQRVFLCAGMSETVCTLTRRVVLATSMHYRANILINRTILVVP